MSWKTINRILGLAAVDHRFWQAVQQDPIAAILSQGFELTPEEQEVFRTIHTKDLSEFSQYLLDKLTPTIEKT